jgi:CheY-like chemotaxis protein
MPTWILLVDNNVATRGTLAVLLRSEGYQTAEAADGRAALAYLRSHPAPGLIFLGLTMPVMDGWQFLAERHRDPDVAAVPVVVFTAANGIDDPAIRAMGAEEVLHKPANDDDLLAAVRRCSRPGRTVDFARR